MAIFPVLCAQSNSGKCGKLLRKVAAGATIGLKRKNQRVRLAEWQEMLSFAEGRITKKETSMNTITYNDSPQIVVTVEDTALIKKIVNAVKMIKGVSSVQITRAENSILDSPSYKSAMRDVDQGHITTYKNADDMFNDLISF